VLPEAGWFFSAQVSQRLSLLSHICSESGGCDSDWRAVSSIAVIARSSNRKPQSSAIIIVNLFCCCFIQTLAMVLISGLK